MRHDLIDVIKWYYLSGVCNTSVEPSTNKEDSFDVSSIKDLRTLKEAMQKIDCELKASATNMVFADGCVTSDVVFVGEAPGAEEDKQGIPFVGQSGQLLNKAIEAIGLSRKAVYITNIIPWRPLGNRTPTNNEIALFRPYLIQHVKIVQPKLVVCLGSSAARAVLAQNTGISKLRGSIISGDAIFESKINIIVTFHPAYLLRSPSNKRWFWDDFVQIAKMLKTHTSAI